MFQIMISQYMLKNKIRIKLFVLILCW